MQLQMISAPPTNNINQLTSLYGHHPTTSPCWHLPMELPPNNNRLYTTPQNRDCKILKIRSPGEGIGYPLQYSWASLVAQSVKNPPAIRETWVWSLGWEDPGRAWQPTPVFLPGDRGAWWAAVTVLRRVRHNRATKHSTQKHIKCVPQPQNC